MQNTIYLFIQFLGKIILCLDAKLHTDNLG